MIFVTVGTDHHRFDRLVDWMERWAARSPIDVVVQHGSSRKPTGVAVAHEFLSAEEMRASFRAATVVVCGAGPGTIMAARKAGCVPIVVPRSPRLGEVVDDHQGVFAEHLVTQGAAMVAWTEERLGELLELAVADPGHFRFDQAETPPPTGIAAMTDLIDELLESHHQRIRRRRARRGARAEVVRRDEELDQRLGSADRDLWDELDVTGDPRPAGT